MPAKLTAWAATGPEVCTDDRGAQLSTVTFDRALNDIMACQFLCMSDETCTGMNFREGADGMCSLVLERAAGNRATRATGVFSSAGAGASSPVVVPAAQKGVSCYVRPISTSSGGTNKNIVLLSATRRNARQVYPADADYMKIGLGNRPCQNRDPKKALTRVPKPAAETRSDCVNLCEEANSEGVALNSGARCLGIEWSTDIGLAVDSELTDSKCSLAMVMGPGELAITTFVETNNQIFKECYLRPPEPTAMQQQTTYPLSSLKPSDYTELGKGSCRSIAVNKADAATFVGSGLSFDNCAHLCTRQTDFNLPTNRCGGFTYDYRQWSCLLYTGSVAPASAVSGGATGVASPATGTGATASNSQYPVLNSNTTNNRALGTSPWMNLNLVDVSAAYTRDPVCYSANQFASPASISASGTADYFGNLTAGIGQSSNIVHQAIASSYGQLAASMGPMPSHNYQQTLSGAGTAAAAGHQSSTPFLLGISSGSGEQTRAPTGTVQLPPQATNLYPQQIPTPNSMPGPLIDATPPQQLSLVQPSVGVVTPAAYSTTSSSSTGLEMNSDVLEGRGALPGVPAFVAAPLSPTAALLAAPPVPTPPEEYDIFPPDEGDDEPQFGFPMMPGMSGRQNALLQLGQKAGTKSDQLFSVSSADALAAEKKSSSSKTASEQQAAGASVVSASSSSSSSSKADALDLGKSGSASSSAESSLQDIFERSGAHNGMLSLESEADSSAMRNAMLLDELD
ncbi:unnamed protein product [Amoebophrya sp. A25]|nr:unnamed protein product [Amoebophrya sp. A25]|eukprot:GSA25T00006102001.1